MTKLTQLHSKISSIFTFYFYLFIYLFLAAQGFEFKASLLLDTLTASAILPTNMYF
jgi:hypothetical protein